MSLDKDASILVNSERYIHQSITNGQNGTSISDVKILHHFVHLPFSIFYNYTLPYQESQYFESGVLYKLVWL